MPRDKLIQLRKGTAAEWSAADPILDDGELGLDTTSYKIKCGNGTDVWSDLDFITDVNHSNSGWGFYADGTYTSGSPLSVNATRVQFLNDGDGATTDISNLPDTGALWDVTNDKILMHQAGDAGLLRIGFKATSSNNNAWFDIELDIGSGGSIVIFRDTLSLIKGVNTEHDYSIAVPYYAAATFVANGGKIYFNTTDSGHNIDFYDLKILVQRFHNNGN